MEDHLSTCSGHFLYLKHYFQSCWFSLQCYLEPGYFSLSPLLPTWSNLPSPLPSLMKTPSQLLSLLSFHSRHSGSTLLYVSGRMTYLYTNLDHITPQFNDTYFIQSDSPPPCSLNQFGYCRKLNSEDQFLFPGRSVLSYFLVMETLLEAKEQKLLVVTEVFTECLEGGCMSDPRKQIALPTLGLVGRGRSQKGGHQLRF